jgi:hypothetical protein
MKSTVRNLLLSLLLLPFGLLNAQITFEADYAHSGAFTQLANSGYKFYIMDVGNRQCRIYNTDHSLWKTIDLDVPAGHYLYDIRYVSENLFTDDNTLSLCYIYYFYDEVYQYYTYTLKIINEDGTNLRTVEGAQYIVVNDIGEAGTKLSVYVYDYSNIIYTITTLVYDLPGQLISSGAGTGHENEALGRSAFPNPAGDYTIIPFALPETSSSGEILLTDAKGNLIRQFKVDHHFRDLRINTGQLPAGIYFYHLTAGNYKSEAKKIIVR